VTPIQKHQLIEQIEQPKTVASFPIIPLRAVSMMNLLQIKTILVALSGLLSGTIATGKHHTSACSAATFKSLYLENVHIKSLDVTAHRDFSTSGRNATGGVGIIPDLPNVETPTVDICLISLTYTHVGQHDTINTYIGLPLDASEWNSRFLMHGGGGYYAGGQSSILTPVLLGYASSSTDGGHRPSESTADWGLTSDRKTNWPALRDFSSLAISEAAVLGKMATRLYYGSKAKYSYWHGCSTGGRQGHAMAQEHPELFDGIVAGAPAINWDKFAAAGIWGAFVAQLIGK
jgi:feruloyl esterase